jgi:hypothetical protein
LVSLDEVDAALSPQALEAIRSHPSFRLASQRTAAGGLEHTEAQDEVTRWLTKDLGRMSLYLAALILHATFGRVSVYNLMMAAEANGTCSRARVLAFVRYARAAGRLDLVRGEGHWTKWALRLDDSFIDYAQTRFWRELESAALVVPEAARALNHRDDARAFPAALVLAGQVTIYRRDLFLEDAERLSPFLSRAAGLQVLHEWVIRQDSVRERLMTEVVLSRRELSRRRSISRAHLNQLLAEGEAQGLLSVSAPDRVCFSPRFSEDMERHFAFTLQMQRLNALAVLSACA